MLSQNQASCAVLDAAEGVARASCDRARQAGTRATGVGMPQGYVPQGYVPQGYVPQGYVPQGYVPQGYVPQGCSLGA
jgi:hypothetical protein